MGGPSAENRHVVFSQKLPGKRTYGVLLQQTLEKTHDVWKGYKYNPTDSGQQCGIGSPCHSAGLCWAFLILIFTDYTIVLVHLAFFTDHHLSCLCRKKYTKDLPVVFQRLLATSEDSGRLAEPYCFFFIKLPLLVCERCS